MILTDTAVSGEFPENFQRIAAYSPAIASIVIFLDPTYNFCNPNVTIQHLYSYFSITNDTASCGRTEVPWNIYLKHISPSDSIINISKDMREAVKCQVLVLLEKSIDFLKYALKMVIVKGEWFDLYENIYIDIDIVFVKIFKLV